VCIKYILPRIQFKQIIISLSSELLLKGDGEATLFLGAHSQEDVHVELSPNKNLITPGWMVTYIQGGSFVVLLDQIKIYVWPYYSLLRLFY